MRKVLELIQFISGQPLRMTTFSASTHGANPSKIVILSAAKDL